MDNYKFGLASEYLYNFVYNDFCSNYIEMSKTLIKSEEEKEATLNVLIHTLKSILIMLSPFTPFICEELYLMLPAHLPSIMEETYPKTIRLTNKKYAKEVAIIIEIISEVRRYKNENNLAPNEKIALYIDNLDFDLSSYVEILSKLAFVDEIHLGKPDTNLPSALIENISIYFYKDVDKEALKTSLLSKKLD